MYVFKKVENWGRIILLFIYFFAVYIAEIVHLSLF